MYLLLDRRLFDSPLTLTTNVTAVTLASESSLYYIISTSHLYYMEVGASLPHFFTSLNFTLSFPAQDHEVGSLVNRKSLLKRRNELWDYNS